MNQVIVDGAQVFFREFLSGWVDAREKASDNDDRLLYDALSGKRLDPEAAVYLIMSNHVLFPNCVATKSDVDDLGFEKTAEQIRDRYEKAKQVQSEFPDWLKING